MGKIADSTVAALRGIEPDELVAHGVIEPAPNHHGKYGFCCPLCGSGSGQNHNGRGDGAGTFDDNGRFFCHACNNADNGGHKLSTIDLFAIANNLQNQPFSEQCRQMCKEFGLVADFDDFDLPQRRRRRPHARRKEKTPPAELELIHADIAVSDEELKDFFNIMCQNGTWRGLPLDILQRHGVKYIGNWVHPKSRADNKFSTPTPRIIIPSSPDSYLARLTCSIDNFDDAAQKYIRPKENAGNPALFNADALNAHEPIFAVEGAIDAMSIELAGFQAVALGGANNTELLVDAADKMTDKPHVVILLDNDESGRKAAEKLRDGLIGVSCPCCVRFLADDVSKIDANEILTTDGVDSLRGRLQAVVDDSLAELDAAEAELAKRHDDRLNDDDLNFFFTDNHSDLAYARRLERFCAGRVKWLTDEERWLTYDADVWTRASEKNSAVLHFGCGLADTLTRHAETKGEHELADKFQSSKKIGAALNLLKACESIRITADDLDRHPNLLNCQNGVIDLETGKLMDAAPELLLTQQVNAAFDANAKSELVEKFFRDIQPDEDTRNGLLRWLGYSLSGETREQKFAIWTGASGANGKSTLSTTLLELFATYGAVLSKNALCKSNRPVDKDAATASLNALENARFSIAEEISVDSELDSSLIKTLSGGDKFVLRRLHCESRTIRPTAKINLSGNFPPRLENSHDGGLRRRMINFPFDVQFDTPSKPADPDLKKKLLLSENLRALLNILVREAGVWYRGGGLIISDAMKTETARHLSQNDFIADFIADNYILKSEASVKAKDFLAALTAEYPAECRRFKRSDLISLIVAQDGVTYGEGAQHARIFKGIGKIARDTFDGEPIDTCDVPFD